MTMPGMTPDKPVKKTNSKKKSVTRKRTVKKTAMTTRAKKSTKKKVVPKKAVRKKSSKKKVLTKKTTKKKKVIKKKLIKSSIIKVPSKKKKPKKLGRVPTGIENLDGLINGGFEQNSTNIVVGSSGSGKSIFAMQFLVEGLRKGEKCLYVTFEEKKDKVYQHMAQFGWNLAEYERKGKFIFLEYTPGKVKTMLEEGGGAIESILLTQKVSRMVIDSITSFELLFDNELEKREAALSLFNMIAKWNCTSLLTLEGKPAQRGTVASRTIEFESDGIVLLYFIRERSTRQRYLEILKMRGTNHSRGIHKFSLETTGVIVQQKPTPIAS